jgi:hypothetical protein
MKTCNRGHQRPDDMRSCSECNKEYHRIRYQLIKDDPEEIRKRKAYRAENKERLAIISRQRGRRARPGRHLEYRRWKEKNPLAGTHRLILARCLDPRCEAFPSYGGRGITVCERWQGKHGYLNFAADMGPKPTPNHTVERIDNNAGYSPDNCKWGTRSEQCLNRRTTKWLTLGGRRQTYSAWAKELGVSPTAFGKRVAKGWTEEQLLQPNHMRRFWQMDQERDSGNQPSVA